MFKEDMTEPLSPTSSNYSCISDSESDSGVDSMSTGSFPPDYMDIDEFLTATGVKQFTPSPNNVVQSFVSQYQGNRLSQQYKLNTKKENDEHVICKTKENQDQDFNIQEELQERETKPKIPTKSSSKKRQLDYSYKYNPLPVGKKARRKFVSDGEKDEKYWKRRVSNNEAARRSRDMRRQREIEISSKWRNLENENERLKKELQKLKDRAHELEKELMEKRS